MPTIPILESLASLASVRRLTDVVMRRYAAYRTAQLNRLSACQIQLRTLLRLVHHARHTQFGVDHGFTGIRTLRDYQRRVPLRTYESFCTEYWQKPFPFLVNVTWPKSIPYFALSSGTTNGTTKYVPLTRAILQSNQKAALTTLALFLSAHPRTPLFTGRLFFLGGSTDLRSLATEPDHTPPYPVLAGDLSGITIREASPVLRPFTFPSEQLALISDWNEKMDLLTQAAVNMPITMLSGIPSWLLVLFDRLRKQTGRERIAEIWPGLRLVIHGGVKFDPYCELFRAILGDDRIHLLETYPASEGFIATEDPCYGQLRLITDHNIFFEFVPIGELEDSNPTRHTVGEVEPGVQYAVVLTTCAGIWSYVLGDTICFEKRDPPLLRFTGRTRYFLSAFGEHVISEEAEKAIAQACAFTNTAVCDFHVGPHLPAQGNLPGRHRWFIEFTQTICPQTLAGFSRSLDQSLCWLNEDYQAHRARDLALGSPEIIVVPPGGFAEWMRSRGRLGGQNKVPRLDNNGVITRHLARFFHIDV